MRTSVRTSLNISTYPTARELVTRRLLIGLGGAVDLSEAHLAMVQLLCLSG